jgi:molybdopterin converting factor small subunit
MKKITIRFRGPVARHIAGGAVEIEVQEGLTITELLSRVIKQEPFLQTLWTNPTEIDRDSMILFNEVDIGVAGGLDAIVNEGDVLTILPLVHGG